MRRQETVVVLGAGGHAKVCIEVLRGAGYHVQACVVTSPLAGTCAGVEVRQGSHWLHELHAEGHTRGFVAVGDNSLREKLSSELEAQGFDIVVAPSPRAILSPTARLAPGVVVMPGAVINADTTVGAGAIVNTGAVIDHDCQIHQFAHVAPRCGLAGNVTVGARAFLGVGTSVIPGVTIGSDTVVGAGATVIRDLPPGITAFGVPARITTRATVAR